jgi:exosortase/archaeosortase family protein
MIIVLIPLFFIFILILVRISSKESDNKLNLINRINNVNEMKKKPALDVLMIEKKKYVFTNKSIIILLLGTPLLSIFIIYFLSLEINQWCQEIVFKQTLTLLNIFTGIIPQNVIFNPQGKYIWMVSFRDNFYIPFDAFCAGIGQISVILSVIIFTPQSKLIESNNDFLWRKVKALVVSLTIFNAMNYIRIIIAYGLHARGFPWEDAHNFVSNIAHVLTALLFLLINHYIPEFSYSIYYGIKFKVINKVNKRRNIISY